MAYRLTLTEDRAASLAGPGGRGAIIGPPLRERGSGVRHATGAPESQRRPRRRRVTHRLVRSARAAAGRGSYAGYPRERASVE